jgi:hypothetical protein
MVALVSGRSLDRAMPLSPSTVKKTLGALAAVMAWAKTTTPWESCGEDYGGGDGQ